MTISGDSAKNRSVSRIARLRRSLVVTKVPVTAAKASPPASTSCASRWDSARVSANAPAVTAITSNTGAIKRKRTSNLLEPRSIVLLLCASLL
jgi:hypothetical protein